MLTFLCVADVHIKVHADIPLEWQQTRYRQLFKRITAACLANQAALILAGDLLDSIRPKREELQLFFELMQGLQRVDITVYLVSGNHETVAKGVSLLDYLGLEAYPNVVYRPAAPILWGDKVALHLLNHDSLHQPPTALPTYTNILVSHFRCNYNPFVREEIDVSALVGEFDLVIAGDIHDAFTLDNKVVYTNNPINKEFEATPNCGWVWLTVDGDGQTTGILREATRFPALRQLHCSADQWPVELPQNDFCRVQITGSVEALRNLPDASDLPVKLDKVPDTLQLAVPEGADARLEAAGGLHEELPAYLATLADLDETRVADMMTFFYQELAV